MASEIPEYIYSFPYRKKDKTEEYNSVKDYSSDIDKSYSPRLESHNQETFLKRQNDALMQQIRSLEIRNACIEEERAVLLVQHQEAQREISSLLNQIAKLKKRIEDLQDFKRFEIMVF